MEDWALGFSNTQKSGRRMPSKNGDWDGATSVRGKQSAVSSNASEKKCIKKEDINYYKGWAVASVFGNIKLVMILTGLVSVEQWGKDLIAIDL